MFGINNMLELNHSDILALRSALIKALESLPLDQSTMANEGVALSEHQLLNNQLAELGLFDLARPQALEGYTDRHGAIAAVLDELGRKLIPTTLVNTVTVLSLCGSTQSLPDQSALVSSIAAGDSVIALAGNAECVPYIDDSHTLVVDESGRISGCVSLVEYGELATHTLVCIQQKNRAQPTQVFLVEHGQCVKVVKQKVNDPLAAFSRLEFSHAETQALSDVDQQAIEWAQMSGLCALAAEQAGASQAIFDLTIEYLKTRYQFGRAVGSFQAVKHMVADLLVELESSKSAVIAAATALDRQLPDMRRAVHLAAFTCADVFREISAQAIQLHGGIAYTREHCAHLYWRRARTWMPMFGSSDQHRDCYLATWEH